MPKIELIASRDFTYNTRRLKAGEPFHARNAGDARILAELLKKATYRRKPVPIPGPPAELRVKLVPAGGIPALRRRYFDVTGKRPFNGWDAETLLEKIAAS